MKDLKKILVALIIFGTSFIGRSYAKNGTEVRREIENAVKFNAGDLSLENNKVDFVKVSFRINDDGKVEVLALNFSDENIKNQLMSKLLKIAVKDNRDSQKVYNYNFSFKKV